MPKTVASVSLTQPSGDPAPVEGGSFTMGGQAVQAGNGPGPDYDMHFQWDQGTGTWTDIGASGNLKTSDTNPVTNVSDYTEQTITVDADEAGEGTYNIRVKTVDHKDSEAEDLSGTQEVTVSDYVAPTRRVMVVA